MNKIRNISWAAWTLAVLSASTSAGQSLSNFAAIDSHASNDLQSPTITYFNGSRHVFDYDATNGDLRWCAPSGSSCTWQVLDGAGGSNGRTTDKVGGTGVASVVRGGALFLFYQSEMSCPEFCLNKLRHAVTDGTTWYFYTLDGDGGANGRTTHAVGGTVSAADWGGTIWVSYGDLTDSDLRLASLSNGTWNFVTHDGAGGGGGKISASVGEFSRLLSTTGYIQIFYTDRTNGDLRHAWWPGSGAWSYATRDGAGGAGTTTDISWGQPGATSIGGVTHLFYTDLSGNLFHAWDIGGWSFAVHDSSNIQPGVAVANDGTNVHVFYTQWGGLFPVPNTTRLRHSWAQNFQAWQYATDDGGSTFGGRVVANLSVGGDAAAASGSTMSVTYRNVDNADIRIGNN